MIEYLDAARVRALLPMPECIDLLDRAMRGVSGGRYTLPPRQFLSLDDGAGIFGVMPGASTDPPVFGAKLISVFPRNPAAGRPAIQGFVALFDAATGRPLAVIDGAEITALRTAAASGLATRTLARPDARTLGVLGTGVQARSHVAAVCAVRPIREVRLWGRTNRKAAELADDLRRDGGPAIRAVETAPEAAECDVVCAVTASPKPVLHGAWVAPGAHVNLVGAHTAETREADTALIARGRVFVDSRASARTEAGDLIIPEREGAIGENHVAGEIGECLLGGIEGRRDSDEVTIYKSLGVVAQDFAAAWRVWQAHTGTAA